VVTLEGLQWLQEQLVQARSADRIKLPGLKDDRRPVIGGGLSVLRAVFDLLALREMRPAQGALRHGALFDLLDREQAVTDVRHTTVQRLAAKFGVDAAQAQRVGRVAGQLLRQLRAAEPAARLQRDERKLAWAAQLHEIGSQISHADYHKHGAYILDNADAPGFAQAELHRLSLLVLGHRGKLRKLEADFADGLFIHQLMCLRLAVILCHARRDPDLQGLKLRGDGSSVTLSFKPDWALAYPQSAHLLREETLAWQKTPWSLALA
jgi:exopolyphosphatase/guanosine-5'-triphosphate,3'-diphosphate pyrophosphatase